MRSSINHDPKLNRKVCRPLSSIVKSASLGAALSITVGCATLTEDAMTPIMLSFSDGSSGECRLDNKRGNWETEIPATVSVRKSDDTLKFNCKTDDGREAVGGIPSTMGGKIIASAVFLDFGITDAITDKHRKYPVSVTIPVKKAGGDNASSTNLKFDPSKISEKKRAQVIGVADSMECNDSIALVEKTAESELWKLSCGDGEILQVRCFDDDCYVKQ